MANYHLSIKIFSRGSGASAVQKAAYRAAEMLTSEYDGETHDYTRKRGIVHKEIMLPENAPDEYADRSVLWNAVEKSERRKDAQLAREIEISLPVELTRERNIILAREFVQQTFVDKGMCADVCVHDNNDGNPHAHIMLTMRPIEMDGTWGKKSSTVNGRKIPTIDWNDRERADEWRKAWEDFQNAALEQNGSDARVDHRSYAKQGLEQIPTVHLGPAASRLEKRGIRTELGDRNREIAVTNQQLRQLRARINKLSAWLKEEAANTAPPTLYDVISEILSRQGRSTTTNLKDAANIFNFLMESDIKDLEDLDNHVAAMQQNLGSTTTELKKVERRIGTLEEHLQHSENFENYSKHKSRYEKLYSLYTTARKETGFGAERKTQKALAAANDYYEAHRSELTMYDNAEQYLRDVLQERFDPKKLPSVITMWRKELTAKYAEKDVLYQKYYKLKDETAKVEKIQRSVKVILHSDMPERAHTRTRGMGL